MIEGFTSGAVDEIHGVFTDFVSAIRQRPVARRFVPMVFEEAERPVGPAMVGLARWSR